MSDPASRLSRPQDARGRIVSIFAGAVLLPSIALSVLSVYSVPKQAEAMKITMFRRAEQDLAHTEKELQAYARQTALDAARDVGLERLLEGRPEVVQAALEEAGYPADMFESLRLEAASPYGHRRERRDRDVEVLRDVLDLMDSEPLAPDEDEDAVELTAGESEVLGTLRFRFACSYAEGPLLQRYFEQEWTNPDRIWVVRVARADGEVLYETAPSPEGGFEVEREMAASPYQGLWMLMRSRERSIEQEIDRWKLAKIGMIGFIDLMLGAGLFLVYSNVRREVHLSRLKSDFVANVSHELKTPLALIRLFAETLELGRVPTEQKKNDYYRVINKESHRLTQLINNILDFSRIEAGRREYRLVSADPRRVIEEVVEAYRFPIEQQGFELKTEIAEDLPAIELDQEAMGQALINLVNNALKYSPEEKQITISARAEGERLRIAVSDRGIGIAKAEQKKIFEKFYRAEDSLVHTTKGSGLGLPLVRHIVEAHDGEVEVISAPGKGSSFVLWLPVNRHGGGDESA